MEKAKNVYFRVFIDNLSQAFYMKGEENYLDLQLDIFYEVLEIFMHFTTISEEVELETWSALISTHQEIFETLAVKKNSSDSHDAEIGEVFNEVVVRNLFVIWIKSHPDENSTKLWKSFFDVVKNRFDETCIQMLWSNTLINLTKGKIKPKKSNYKKNIQNA
jgi:hypothetical protein